MKTQLLSFLVLFFLLVIGCGKSTDENVIATDNPILQYEKREVTEYEGDILVDVKPKEYCVWTVSSVVGDSCKYSVGDNICYLCDEDGCPPGVIALFKNFGDGCATYGSWSDQSCEEKEDGDCAGKYL